MALCKVFSKNDKKKGKFLLKGQNTSHSDVPEWFIYINLNENFGISFL